MQQKDFCLRKKLSEAAGNGIVFYPGGERVEGYTNPLWVFCLAWAALFRMPLPFTAYWMSMISAVLTIFMTVLLYRRTFSVHEGPTIWSQYYFPCLAACLVVADVAFNSWSASGMETLGYTFLLLWIIHLLQSSQDVRLMFVVLVLLALVRPEGVFFLPPALLFMLRTRHSFPILLRLMAAYFVIPYVLFLIFRVLYFGDLFPNSFYAKWDEGGGPLLERGLVYVQTFFRPRILFVLALLWLFLEESRPRLWGITLLIFGLVQAATVVVEGGDHFALHRFLVPSVPLLSILSVRGIERLVHRLLYEKVRKKSGFSLVMIQSGVALATVFVLAAHGLQLYEYKGMDAYGFSNGARWHQSEVAWADNWANMGSWLQEKYPSDTTIAVTTAGAIPFYSRLRCIDILGINDVTIAHQPIRDRSRRFTGHEKSDPDYVLLQEPRFIQLFPMLLFGSQPFPKERLPEMLTYPAQYDLWNHPEFQRNYEYKTESTAYGVIGYFERIESPASEETPPEPPPPE